MKRSAGAGLVLAFVILIIFGASQLRAQDEESTFEQLVTEFRALLRLVEPLPSAQQAQETRITALETAVASANLLAGIPIEDEDRCTPYSADNYRYPQSLEAQLVAETGGRFYSPYTGETFTRTDEVDVDHIVARSEAHDSGLCAADTFTRLAFASDLLNLTFATPQLNRDEKTGKDLAEWLPEMNRCWFVNRVVAVKRRYGLSMDAREAEVARTVLLSCSSFAMEFNAEAAATPVPEATSESDASPGAENHPLSLYDSDGNGRITCKEAEAHGIAPVKEDHPAYQYMNDADNDGKVCE